MAWPRNTREVAELFRVNDEEPEPRASRSTSSEILKGDYEEHTPPEDEMAEYWRIYESFPVVRMSITAFAEEIVEPGWYVVANNEDTAEELTEWLTESGTISGEEKQDFLEILRETVVQREVRGTALVEKVRGKNSGKVVALQGLNPETFNAYTRPKSNVLIAPDDVDLSDEKVDEIVRKKNNRTRYGNKTIPITDEGDAAAYVQWDDTVGNWGRQDETYFTRDDIIKVPRDADVGEIFGTSRIESIADRVHGLQQKLKDNDEAISQKAYPFWMFKAGPESGEETWEEDDMDEFMANYDMDEFAPGMKTMVPGSVSLETFSGETADIYESVKYDIDHIAFGLPTPQFSLGAFGENVGKARARMQENRFNRRVKDVRGELESKFTPLLREVAEERDLDDPEEVALKLGRPNEPSPEMQGQNVIRYTSDSPQGAQPGDQPGPGFSAGPNDTNFQQNQGPNQNEPQAPRANDPTDSPSAMGVSADMYTASPNATGVQVSGGGSNNQLPVVQLSLPDESSVWNADTPDYDVEELADPRYVSIRDERRSLSKTMTDYIVSVRDDVLDAVETKRSGKSRAMEYERTVDRIESDSKHSSDIEGEVSDAMENVIRGTLNSMSQQYHSPRLSTYYGVQASNTQQLQSNAMMNSIDGIVEDMKTYIHQMIIDGVQSGEDWDRIRKRVEKRFSKRDIRNRSNLVIHMELKNGVEGTKLSQYEASDEVIGVKVLNPCTEATTRLCRNLAGCTGTQAEAYFGPEKSISDQLQNQISSGMTYKGFEPLPAAPPYHYNCRSTLAPIAADEEELEDGSIMFEETDTVMCPEGPGIVVRVMDQPFQMQRGEGQPQRIEARPDYRAYIVRLVDKDGKQVFREEDLEQAEATFETTKQKRKREREDVADEEIDNEMEERRKEEEKRSEGNNGE